MWHLINESTDTNMSMIRAHKLESECIIQEKTVSLTEADLAHKYKFCNISHYCMILNLAWQYKMRI